MCDKKSPGGSVDLARPAGKRRPADHVLRSIGARNQRHPAGNPRHRHVADQRTAQHRRHLGTRRPRGAGRCQCDRPRQGARQYARTWSRGISTTPSSSSVAGKLDAAVRPASTSTTTPVNPFQPDMQYRGFPASPWSACRRAWRSIRTACASTRSSAIPSTGTSSRRRRSGGWTCCPTIRFSASTHWVARSRSR